MPWQSLTGKRRHLNTSTDGLRLRTRRAHFMKNGHEDGHEHGFELAEVLRVVFVAACGGGGLVSSMGAISQGKCDWTGARR